MKKILSFLLLLAVTFCLFGCNSPFNDDDLGLDNVDGKVTVTVGILNDNNEKNMFAKLKTAFEKQNGLINIKAVYIQSDYHSGMGAYIKKPADMPDIIWTAGDMYSPYSSQGIFVDVSKYFAQDDSIRLDNFVSSVFDLTHYGPHGNDSCIYFVPRDYSKPVTFINKAIFAAAKIPVPAAEEWNYKKFLEVCKALREAMDTNTDQAAAQVGLNSLSYPVESNLHWQPCYYPSMKHFGAEPILQSENVSNDEAIAIDSEKCVDAYNTIYDDLVETKFTTNPADGDQNIFIQSKAAMMFEVRPNLPAAVAQGIDIEFLPFPFDYDGTGCSGYAITDQARLRKNDLNGTNNKNNEELAWEFLKFMLSEEGQEIMSATGSLVPVRESLWNKEGAKWRSYISDTLNHEVFLTRGEGESDVNLNVVHRFPAQSHILMQRGLDEAVNSAMLDQYHKEDNSLFTYLTLQKNNMKDILKNNS